MPSSDRENKRRWDALLKLATNPPHVLDSVEVKDRGRPTMSAPGTGARKFPRGLVKPKLGGLGPPKKSVLAEPIAQECADQQHGAEVAVPDRRDDDGQVPSELAAVSAGNECETTGLSPQHAQLAEDAGDFGSMRAAPADKSSAPALRRAPIIGGQPQTDAQQESVQDAGLKSTATHDTSEGSTPAASTESALGSPRATATTRTREPSTAPEQCAPPADLSLSSAATFAAAAPVRAHPRGRVAPILSVSSKAARPKKDGTQPASATAATHAAEPREVSGA